jgi:hypothetical protein
LFKILGPCGEGGVAADQFLRRREEPSTVIRYLGLERTSQHRPIILPLTQRAMGRRQYSGGTFFCDKLKIGTSMIKALSFCGMAFDDSSSKHICEVCGASMPIARITPGVASLRELHIFRCDDCGHVETIEVK